MKLVLITLFSATISLLIVHNAAENAPKAPDEDNDLLPKRIVTPSMASATKNPKIPEIHLNFAEAFIKTFFIIIISEIGDKTFFIAAIMAMKHPRTMVFFGAISALALMTIISVLCGWAFSIIPKRYTYYGSVILFLVFGLKMIYDGLKMSPNEAQEEYDEVQAELRKREEEHAKRLKKFAKPKKEAVSPIADTDTAMTMHVLPDVINEYDGNSVVGVNGSLNGTSLRTASDERRQNEAIQFEKEVLTKDIETGGYMSKDSKRKIFQMLSHILVQAFTLTFLAEWGDRSQISTMALAIKDDKFGITVGGIAGHGVCTGLAVIGGRYIAQKISVKTVTIVGGFVFILFALITLFLESSETPNV